MASQAVGFVYDIKNPDRPQYQWRNGRVVDNIKWKEHDPDEEIDLNNFPHREILGPGYDEFHPQMKNFGTMKIGEKFHHDHVSNAARSKDSFFRGTWPSNYYACMEWITMPDGDRVRCLFTILVNSGGCHHHTSPAGYNQILKDAQHGKKITWRDVMDPIELLKMDYEKAKKARMEAALETTFATGLDYQQGMKKIEELEEPCRNDVDKEIATILEATRLRDPNGDKADDSKTAKSGGRKGGNANGGRRGRGSNAA